MSVGSRLALLALFGWAGCSTTRFDHDPCTAHEQCRASFGFGAVCQPDGFCGPAALPRCDRTYPEDLLGGGARYRDATVVGSLIDRSSAAHAIRENAVRLAVKEANDAGGLDGRTIGLIQCDIQENAQLDGASRTRAAVEAATWLTQTLGVPAVIGPASSADAQEVWEATRTTGALVISPSATSQALAKLEPDPSDADPGLLWTVAPTDGLQAEVIADDMLARNVVHAHLLRETGVYGEGLANLVAERFREGGGTLQIESLPAEARIGAATAAAFDGSKDGPASEVVFISSQQSWVIKFLQEAGQRPAAENRTIFLTDAAANQAVFEAAAAAAPLFARIRGTRPTPLDPSEYVYASFAAGYRAEYDGQNPAGAIYSAHAYDATWLALYGAAWSALREGAVTGRGIARGLRRIGSGDRTPIVAASWKPALAAFRAGKSIDLHGASGELDYDPATRELHAPIEIWSVTAQPIEIRPSE